MIIHVYFTPFFTQVCVLIEITYMGITKMMVGANHDDLRAIAPGNWQLLY
jgi:hypothetical protein